MLSLSLIAAEEEECSGNAPAALRFDPGGGFGFDPPTMGVTADGVARARFPFGDCSGGNVSLGQGVVGTRAYLSTDGGATFPEIRPRRRVSNEGGFIILDELTPDTSYTARFVSVTNLGRMNGGTVGAFTTPLEQTDFTPEAPPVAVAARSTPSGVYVDWHIAGPIGDIYGFVLERAKGGGPFSVVVEHVPMSWCTADVGPHWLDVVEQGGTYFYRVRTVDLSGNVSGPSDASVGVVVP